MGERAGDHRRRRARCAFGLYRPQVQTRVVGAACERVEERERREHEDPYGNGDGDRHGGLEHGVEGIVGSEAHRHGAEANDELLTSIPAAILMHKIGRKHGFILATLFGIVELGIAGLLVWLFGDLSNLDVKRTVEQREKLVYELKYGNSLDELSEDDLQLLEEDEGYVQERDHLRRELGSEAELEKRTSLS